MIGGNTADWQVMLYVTVIHESSIDFQRSRQLIHHTGRLQVFCLKANIFLKELEERKMNTHMGLEHS